MNDGEMENDFGENDIYGGYPKHVGGKELPEYE